MARREKRKETSRSRGGRYKILSQQQEAESSITTTQSTEMGQAQHQYSSSHKSAACEHTAEVQDLQSLVALESLAQRRASHVAKIETGCVQQHKSMSCTARGSNVRMFLSMGQPCIPAKPTLPQAQPMRTTDRPAVAHDPRCSDAYLTGLVPRVLGCSLEPHSGPCRPRRQIGSSLHADSAIGNVRDF
eukprot:450075-Pleurochrysis_carterae.AAC.7